ncbi:MAG: polysaccharide biosynthesis protein [Chloroflexi bacterium]|nr:polysaccharide biosynthesis protein [Chloroflexota bacterium]
MAQEQFYLRNRYVFFLDLALIAFSVVAAFIIRLDLSQFYIDYIPTTLWMLAVALLIKPLVYRRFGLYQRFWAYASTPELRLIALAATAASFLVGVVMFSLFGLRVFIFFPRTVIAIDWVLSLLLVGAVRFAPRLLAENRRRAGPPAGRTRRVLVAGAGDAGALVVRELQKNPQLRLAPAAFLDDDPNKQGYRIHEVEVVGTLADLPTQLESGLIDEVIFAIPSAPGAALRRVAEVCRAYGTPFRTMPGIYELLGGKLSISRLRQVDIADLLRRAPTQMDDEHVGLSLSGKRVLVTGAGGSIASELCRQVARWGPAEMILLGHGENSIFAILLELEESFPALALQPVIADVRDRARLEAIFQSQRPQVVFHAAAHKHVSLMEKNVEEAVTNNILGTRSVVAAAQAHGVERLVMISTDKAVRPSSVMGVTKRVAEMLVLDAARSGAAFSVVRFGNVLGSRGSVVPVFESQIRAGGPVTITHPDVERFFMTIPEAVHLVLQAFALGQGGEVFLLDMGQPVRILDLAEDLIRLSGLEPGRDIEIIFTGLRPGEKLTEELADEGTPRHATAHPEIHRLAEDLPLAGPALSRRVDDLLSLAQDGEVDELVRLLDETVPGARIRSAPPPDLTAVV